MGNKSKSLVSIDSEHCKSCGISFQGDFCHACGQKRIYNRFTLKQSSVWLFTELFNLDHGFFYTSKEMLLRPHVVIKEYLSGSTKKYMHPFRFLFVWVTIYSLLSLWLGFNNSDQAFQEMGMEPEDEQVKKAKIIIDLFQKYSTLIIMLGVPFMAIGTMLVYKSKKMFFTEHLIFHSFAYGGSIILSLPILSLFYLPEGIFIQSYVNSFSFIIYFSFVFFKFYKEHFMESLVKVIFSFIVSIITGFILGLITAIPLVIFFKDIIKEFFKA